LLTLLFLFVVLPLATIVLTAGKTNREVFREPFSRPKSFGKNFYQNLQDA
jgi:ABC-type glycerol-3-phosphate transport system permease component